MAEKPRRSFCLGLYRIGRKGDAPTPLNETFMRPPLNHSQQGFSLVELTIVVVILGVLATFAVPRFQSSVERTKASEGFVYLKRTQEMQERFMATVGRYAYSKEEIKRKTGERLADPQFFRLSSYSSANWERRWAVKLTRSGASSGYGGYSIVWSQDGFDERRSTVPDDLR